MRAKVERVDDAAERKDLFSKLLVQRDDLLFGRFAARDDRLVRHHHDDEASLVNHTQRLGNSREEHQVTHLFGASYIANDHSVAVEKDGSLHRYRCAHDVLGAKLARMGRVRR